ncbi:MAG: lantibiotic dehydratase [Candidatus Omnitrophica bacterium]|nr:lantibiotic dehydratase [Candidatus Omnitrophota bacterium]
MKNSWKICKYFTFRCAGFPFELMETVRFKDAYQIIDQLLEKEKKGPLDQKAKDIFKHELYRKRLQLQKIVSTKKFQEAVFHQNQNNYQGNAYGTIANLSRQKIDPDKRNYESRQQEFLAYRYLQRFCTKNETVSFFGPFYIDKFDNVKKNMVFKKSGSNKIKNRKTYITTWLLKAILDKIIHDPEVFRMLKPRMVPVIYLDGKQPVHGATGKRIGLDRISLKILRLVKQEYSIKEISAIFKKQRIKEEKLLTKVMELIENGLLLSGLEVAAHIDQPDKYLINKLADIPAAIKNEWYVKLIKLSKLKSEFEKVNFEDREKIIFELRSLFLPLLNNPQLKDTKHEKGFFTEYCESDIDELKLGKNIYHDLEDSLSLMLNLASYNKASLNKINRSLLRNWLKKNFSGKEISIKDFISKIGKSPGRMNSPFKIGERNFLNSAADDLPVDFINFINQDRKSNQVEFSRNELKKKFSKFLDKTGLLAGTCCDISLDSSSEGTINKGGYKIVFGEAHRLRKALSVYKWMVESASGGGKLIREIKNIHKRISKHYTLGDFSVIPQDILDKGYDFPAVSQISYNINSERKKNKMGIFDLKLHAGQDSVSLVDGRKKKPVLFLNSPIAFFSLFSVLSPEISNVRFSETRTHFPRVKIDKFIFQRESWIFLKKDLFFAQESFSQKGLELWLVLDQWRRKEGIPKQFFMSISTTSKPFFVDFENYFAVEVFMNFIKKAKEKLSITEMLPGPEGLWFKDDEGRYTSEFRLIAYKNTNPYK